MKRNTKLLIGAGIAAGLLGAVLAVVLMLPSDNKDDNEKTSEPESVLLYDKTGSVPEDITIKNTGGEYEIIGYKYTPVQQSSKDDESSSSNPIVNPEVLKAPESEIPIVYTMQEYPNELLSKKRTDALYKDSQYLAAKKVIDTSGKNYKEYGLEEPRAEVTILFDDNSTKSFSLGDDAPDNAGIYVKMSDDSTVYVVPTDNVDTYLTEKLQMFDNTITSSVDEDITVTSMSFSGEFYEKTITVTDNSNIEQKVFKNSYYMKEPYLADCKSKTLTTVKEKIFGMEGTEIAAICVSEDDIKKYGLDKPYISITAELSNGNELTVKASKADDDGKCYVMNKSGTTIFRMNSKSIEWYGLSRNDILTENILSIDMKYMKTLTIKENGKTSQYDFEAKEIMTDNYSVNRVVNVYKDGKKIDYTVVMDYVEALSSYKRSDDVPSDLKNCKKLLEVELAFDTKNKEKLDMSFYSTPDNKKLVVYNGTIEGYADSLPVINSQ